MYNVKIRIQGGINAANGLSGIFMVTSVTAVSDICRTRREEQHVPDTDSKKKNGQGLFAGILEKSLKEVREDVLECCTTTYGRDSKMQTFLYRTREYRY